MTIEEPFQAHLLLPQGIEKEHVTPFISFRDEPFYRCEKANDLPGEYLHQQRHSRHTSYSHAIFSQGTVKPSLELFR